MKVMASGLLVILSLTLLAACGGLSSKQRAAVDDALKAMRKIEASTQVGVGFQRYGEFLTDVQAAVNETNTLLPEGELKKSLSAARECYVDAHNGWQQSFDRQKTVGDGTLTIYTDIGQYLSRKYNLPWEDTILGHPKGISRQNTLNKIWAAASVHLNQAASLAS